MLRVGGMQLFRMESSDRSEKVLPRATQFASALIYIYLTFSVVCTLAYLAAGMSFLRRGLPHDVDHLDRRLRQLRHLVRPISTARRSK